MSQLGNTPPPPPLDPSLCPPSPGTVTTPLPSGATPVAPGPALPSCALTPQCWQQWYADAQLGQQPQMVTALDNLTAVMSKIEQSLEDKLFLARASIDHCSGIVCGDLARRLDEAEAKIGKCCSKIAGRLATLMGEAQGRLASVGIFPTPQAPITEVGPYVPLQESAPLGGALASYLPQPLPGVSAGGPAQPGPGNSAGNGAGPGSGGSNQSGMPANGPTGPASGTSGGNAGGTTGVSGSSSGSSPGSSPGSSSGPAPILSATGKSLTTSPAIPGTTPINLGGGSLWIDSQSHPVQITIQCFGLGDLAALIDQLRSAGVIPKTPAQEPQRLQVITLVQEPPHLAEDWAAEE